MKILQNTLKINTANRASTILYRFLLNSNITSWILPANICYIVPLVFLKAEKNIHFIDISSDTLLIDELELFNLLSYDKVKGVLLNHTYGIEYDFNFLVSSIKSKYPKSSIIEDKCLCIPEFLEHLNPDIDLVLYSTGYAKSCDLGFGGYGYTNMKIEKNIFGYNPKLESSFLENIKMEILGGKQFDHQCNIKSDWLDNSDLPIDINEYFDKIKRVLPDFIDWKNSINIIYGDNIPINIQFPTVYQNWRFNILTDKKTEILNKLFSNNHFASSHYADLSFYFQGIRAVNTDFIFKKIINLFNDKYISLNQVREIVEIIKLSFK
ncbi:MAG: hypothetical protein WCP85_29265 [Mariniphaga sp.]